MEKNKSNDITKKLRNLAKARNKDIIVTKRGSTKKVTATVGSGDFSSFDNN